jgi:membrane fusion protein (multidrug efflux system)
MDLEPSSPAPVPFRSTLRSLRTLDEREHRALTVLGLAAAVAWAVWSLTGTIPLYATSDTARVEAAQSTFQIASTVDGKILRADLQLGQVLQKDDLLVELDSTTQRMLLEEGRAAITALHHDLDAVRDRAAVEVQAAAAEQSRQALAIEEAAAADREARAQSDMAARRATDVARLLAGGLVAESDAAVMRQEGNARQARWEAARLAWRRAGKARDVSAAEATAKRAAIDAERVRLEGELALAERRLQQLEHDVELRRVLAPASGIVGELGNVHVGTVVAAGERLGVLVPDDTLRIVADLPGEMLAKIRPGQRARFRFEGYPALAHGSAAAVVSRIGSEARGGSVEVVLSPQRDPAARLPLQHGVRGTIDIEIERVTPAALLLRRIGALAEPARPEPGR